MPEWLIILIVFFVVSRVVRSRGDGARCMSGRSHRLDRAARRTLRRERQTAIPAAKPETPMEALQRRYVDGSITVEQYEAELDKLYRGS
jgi:uncharacterized membrane protein